MSDHEKQSASHEEESELIAARCGRFIHGNFLVAAIGASAGGIEAFSELMRNLPSDTGMAFVLIQRLDPKHHSILTELIARETTMPAKEVTDNLRLEPNHIYVAPIHVGNMKDLYFMILFQETPEPKRARSPKRWRCAQEAQRDANRILKLEQELAATKEYLQSVIEAQEAHQ